MGEKAKTQSRFHDDALTLLEGFRLMDDDFFSEALDGKIDAVQFTIKARSQWACEWAHPCAQAHGH